MSIRPEDLIKEQTDYPLGPRSRFFFEADEIDFRRAKRHARRLDGLNICDDTWQSSPGCSPCWTLTFRFEGHLFQIDTNHHAANSLFFVGDRECPDDVLLRVVNHFGRLTWRGFHASTSRSSAILGVALATALLLGVATLIVLVLLSNR